MEKQYSDDTFLARWISGELTPEELSEFKKSKDYKSFERINKGAQNLSVPAYNKNNAFSKLQEDINKKTKTVKLIPNWAYRAAAILVVALSVLFFLNNKSTHFKTGVGEQLVVTLPDNSKVNLNANSSIKFKEKDWSENRELKFSGEAFFDVEKGSSFRVKSDEGIVEVLGTEFNVISKNNFFEIKCYEGKVKVLNSGNNDLAILTLGKAFRVHNKENKNWTFIEKTPTWIQGESSFKDMPLKQVIKALEDQYEIKFDISLINLNRRFTGSFTHKNLKLALQTVFTPMNINYTTSKNNTIILKDKK
ncbi:hypothetical protein BFR04_05600 [Gaetbulibacter sp. 4G1]|nr:FecR family protein [Gaetbulibacter sp. 4G1]PIA78995.1 hypothetical protein BFR04_05600 [Gaetbulibacter sp. 4G1]